MITAEDFTLFPEGRIPSEMTVVTCPCCGRHGVLEWEARGVLCVHSETTTVLADGMLVEFTDSCELPQAG